ncbi:hypothetical protein ACTA71_007943 [Dictyostelium dimigraforme]
MLSTNGPQDTFPYLKPFFKKDINNLQFHLDKIKIPVYITDFQLKDTDILLQICVDLIVAATDTIYYNDKLFIEVAGNDCKVLKYEQISKMPYLYGIYGESLRYRPVTPLSLPRVDKS